MNRSTSPMVDEYESKMKQFNFLLAKEAEKYA